nr:hypothetical protein [Tanacetum cinerariifolium]
MEADDQAIQTILMGLPEDIYAAVDSFQTSKEIWLRVEHMMKGFTIGAQEKKAKLISIFIITWNQNGYNVVQNVKNRAVQNLRVQNVGNQNGLIVVPDIAPLIANHNANQNGNENVIATQVEVRPRRRDAAYLQTQLLIAQKEEARIQLQAEEFDVMDVAGDIDEIKDGNENYILMANFQQASTSSTQIGKALIYDLDGTSEVHDSYNCYDNEIFNMFTQEGQYTELLEPISKPH